MMDSGGDLERKQTYTCSIDIHKKRRISGRTPQTKEGMIEFGESGPHIQNMLVGS